MEKIKVLSLNIWLGRYLDEIIALINVEQPDVLLLQEVPKDVLGTSEEVNGHTLSRLKAEFGGVCEYRPMWRKVSYGKSVFKMGLAVFTKRNNIHVVDEFYYKKLTKLEFGAFDAASKFPGLLLGLGIKVGGVEVVMATTHFVWSLYPEINTYQKEAVVGLIKCIEKYDEIILGGDFNVTDESEIYKKLNKVLIDDRPNDVKRTLHPTIHRAGDKNLAVDFMFHKGNSIRTISSKILEVPTSDHLPVIVEYKIG